MFVHVQNDVVLIVQVLLRRRWHVAGKDHTMGWDYVPHCRICALTGMPMRFGILSIQLNVPTGWSCSR